MTGLDQAFDLVLHCIERQQWNVLVKNAVFLIEHTIQRPCVFIKNDTTQDAAVFQPHIFITHGELRKSFVDAGHEGNAVEGL